MRREGRLPLARFRPVVAEPARFDSHERWQRHGWRPPAHRSRGPRRSARSPGPHGHLRAGRGDRHCAVAVGRDIDAARQAIDSMVVRCYFDAFNERNFATCMVTHAPNWSGRFRPGPLIALRGREVNLARLRALGEALPGVRLGVVDVRADGPLVIVRFDVLAPHEPAASGARGFAVFRLARGRIVDEYVVHPLLARHARMFVESFDGGLELA